MLILDKTCLWDCTWETNVCYKYHYPCLVSFSKGTVEDGKRGKVDLSMNYRPHPRIQKDMTCLQDCFTTNEIGLIKRQ